MEQKIKSLFFIKTNTFIILTWIFFLYNDMSTFCKFVGEYNIERTLDIKSYRLVAECSQYKDSRNTYLKGMIHENDENENVITNSNICDKIINKQSSKSSLYKKQFNKGYIRQRMLKYRGKYLTLFERKLFKHLDYIDFIRKNPSITNKSCKKVLLKEYGILMYLPFLLVSCGLILPIIPYFYTNVINFYKKLYCVFILILFAIFELGIVYMFVKIKKHRRIMKRRA
ncbi:Plasmodium exported protein, unknown function [Plasmodium malariae]|uniref:Variable surface protein n=1 Tax=Plasmodium malariae TaxID=5858 RepID=A0A1D3JI11_PLAMA|nr:Plasmodium exported protein, unknown function [Plasmodium malariae]SBT85890.1 Plasmodium exported protein, unknown function [Plasmodium malariae]